MITVGIVGCGKIADQHAACIERIANSRMVAACDKEELMAKQFAERFRVANYFDDITTLLLKAKPDVVHITTPPQSHFMLGKKSLEAGCNVYIEKPFTLNTAEAQTLIDIAKQKDLKLTAGHNLQFGHASRRMRQAIKEGYLGGPPIHMESYYGYDLGDARYAKALLGDKNHWVRALPGRLMHNLISHGISRIAEFLISDTPQVVLTGFTSSLLRSIGEDDIIDELRVIIDDGGKSTAYFTFSTKMRPVLRQFRVFGPRNALVVDDDKDTLIRLRGTAYKSYLEQFIPPFTFAGQYLSNATYAVSYTHLTLPTN